jgi:endonuclease/exonuclease/phosphatase (EEP) superfamily protein YafD
LLASVATVAAFLSIFASLGGGTGVCPPSAWTLLAFNTGDDFGDGSAIAELCRRKHVDVLSLQEVSPSHRLRLVESLPDYTFFAGDPAHEFETGARRSFTCVTGIRRALLFEEPRVETAITGYRTFALRIRSGDTFLWIVNVHGTKPIWRGKPWWATVTNAWRKARWHREERDRLEAWLLGRNGEPMVLAGDFNAPEKTWNVRFPGFVSAHETAGRGLGWTFPRRLPILRIDHVLGNNGIQLCAYETFDAGFSDHRGQLARFTIAQTSTREPGDALSH